MRYRARVAYVGTFFHGWQMQENAPRTVQGVLEESLVAVLGEPARVHAAGRTDAGVHAEGQEVHFDGPVRPCEAILAVNRRLPWDVRILSADPAAEDFHARASARSKLYRYRFSRERTIPPREILWTSPCPSRADAALLAEAARRLEGTHDFFPFSTSGTDTATTERTLHSCTVEEDGPRITIALVADGFLRGMARAIVGTLADIARGHVSIDLLDEIFASNSRELVRPKAKPRGLTLERVNYGLIPR